MREFNTFFGESSSEAQLNGQHGHGVLALGFLGKFQWGSKMSTAKYVKWRKIPNGQLVHNSPALGSLSASQEEKKQSPTRKIANGEKSLKGKNLTERKNLQ